MTAEDGSWEGQAEWGRVNVSRQARDIPSYRAGGTKDHAVRNDISKWQKLSGIPEGQVRCAHVLSDVTH